MVLAAGLIILWRICSFSPFFSEKGIAVDGD